MKNTEVLKKNKKELELQITKLIRDFMNENGECEVELRNDYQYIMQSPVDAQLVYLGATVILNIK